LSSYNLLGDCVSVYRQSDTKIVGTISYTLQVPTTPLFSNVLCSIGAVSDSDILTSVYGNNMPEAKWKMSWQTEPLQENDIVLWQGTYYILKNIKKDLNHYTMQNQYGLLCERKTKITGLNNG
jgi:hypothetical protein